MNAGALVILAMVTWITFALVPIMLTVLACVVGTLAVVVTELFGRDR